MPWLFSNSSPTCSNTRFLLLTSRSSRMFGGGRSLAIRFMGSGRKWMRACGSSAEAVLEASLAGADYTGKAPCGARLQNACA